MAESKIRTTVRYVVPTMLGSICFFLFTIIDGIFVGHGVGADGLGAVNRLHLREAYEIALQSRSEVNWCREFSRSGNS